MEVSCPNCTQRLRYSDTLVNPLLRCGNCKTTFRPAELALTVPETFAAVAVDEDVRNRDYPFQEPATEPSLPDIEPSPAKRAGKSGFGYLTLVLLLIGFKVGPRLVREFFRERKPPPPPQLRHDDRQAIQRMLQEAAQNAKNARGRPDVPEFPMPDRFAPRNP